MRNWRKKVFKVYMDNSFKFRSNSIFNILFL